MQSSSPDAVAMSARFGGAVSERVLSLTEGRGALVLVAGGFGVLTAIASALTDFHVGLNDFWGNLFVASALDLSRPASLHDGFYPIGYAVLLRLAGRHAVWVATIANLLVWSVVLAALAVWARRLAGPIAALLAIALVASEPRLFAHAISAGSDIPAVALFAIGTVLACEWISSPHARPRVIPPVAIGVLLGMAGLIRYHALVAGLAVIVGVACATRGGWRIAVPMLVGASGTYCVQVAVNLAAGAGPLETSQAFNVYRMTHGIDWFLVSPDTAPRSVVDVVRQDPAGVWSAYLWSLRDAVLPLALAAAAATRSDAKLARTGRVLLVASALYALIVSLGASSRAWLPFLPILLTVVAALSADMGRLLSSRLSRRSGRALLGGMAVAALAIGVVWARADVRTVSSRRRVAADYRSIETQLFEVSDARRPAAVFTSDFDLYFPSRYPHAPFRNGGWMRYGTYGYEAAFPTVCVETIECFARDARLREISHVVLGPTSGRQSPALGAVYDDPAASPLLVSVGQRGAWRIYRFASAR